MRKLLIILIIVLFATTGYSAEFFSDDFESGNLDSPDTTDDSHWKSGSSTDVVSEKSRSGDYSLKFHYEGDTDEDADAQSEQRFAFGEEKTDLYVRYYIYFPENYEHRDVSPNNNKIIRIWSDEEEYDGDSVKVGASLSYDSEIISDLFPEGYKSGYGEDVIWDYDGSNGPLYNSDWGDKWGLTSDDLGRWICFEWHFSPDDGTGTGAHEFWVDGVKQWGTTDHDVANAPPPRTYFKAGYLMGWANSGYDEDTYIYIDDVVMSDSYIGPEDGDGDGDGDTTPPGLEEGTIASDGTSLILDFSESVYQGSGYDDSDFSLTGSESGELTITYDSGDGTDTHEYTIDSTVQDGEDVTLDFNGDTDSLEDDAGNDLEEISDYELTNDSTAGDDTTPPEPDSVEIWNDGVTVGFLFDEKVYIGTGGSGGMSLSATGGDVSLTHDSGDGETYITYTADREIQNDETVTASYEQPGDGLEDELGNDVESFSGFSVDNVSLQGSSSTGLIGVGSGGGQCHVVESGRGQIKLK